MSRVAKLDAAESAALRRELLARGSRGELHWATSVLRMRRSLGKSQEQFGCLFGLTRRQIAEIETGKANPTVETLNRIGKAFGLVAGFVLNEEDHI